MVCIYCGSSTGVTNSRPQKRTNTVWRRRQCHLCRAVFTTEEAVILASVIVITRVDGPTSTFSKEKLLISLYGSLKHRPTALPDAISLTDTVISQLLPHMQLAAIPVGAIITTATKVLQRFDQAAAVQYRAYHPTAI